MAGVVRVLGTGGTIAGVASPGAADNRYTAGQLAVRELLRPLLAQAGGRMTLVGSVDPIEVAQVDSCNMSHAIWARLADAVRQVQEDADVRGAVITHGTDTLEETAVFLDAVVLNRKPVVMTAAMRPATSAQADGPAHLAQALALVADPAACGLLFAFTGRAWRAADVRKLNPFDLDAFGGGQAQPVALWEADGGGTTLEGRWRWMRSDRDHLVEPDRLRVQMPQDPAQWPVIEIVSSHAGATGACVRALLDSGAQGLVISATGNGSIHQAIDAALHEAMAQGRLDRERVLVASRCVAGGVVGEPAHGWPLAANRTPAQARVELMVRLAHRASLAHLARRV